MDRLNEIKLCRSCLSPMLSGFNIFETIYKFKINQTQSENEVPVSEIFERLTGIILNENDLIFPKYLCFSCSERLFNAYEFFELCKLSDEELKKNTNTADTFVEFANLEDHISTKGDNTDDLVTSDQDAADSCSDNNDEKDLEDPIELNGIIGADEDLSNKSTRNVKLFDCLKCNEVFRDSVELKRHERIHEGNWSCTECDKILTTKYTFRNHMMIHLGKPFQCQICPLRFARTAALNRHTRVYHLRGRFYECDECPKRFYTKTNLRSHKKSHLKKKRKNGRIGDLDNDTEINQILNKPLENDDGSRLIDQNQIKIKFEAEEYIIQNVELSGSHEPSIISETCENISSDTPQIVKAGNPLSTSEVYSRYYRCKMCFKKFRHRNNYLRHLKLMTNCQTDLKCRSNPQKCEYCSLILNNVSDLRKHLETDHMNQDPFRCKLCNNNYTTWTKLAGHTRKVHFMNKRYHGCTVCCRGFPSAKLLEEHRHVHKGSRNYKCEFCDLAFYTQFGLKQHLATHSRVVQCGECGKLLADKGALQNHLTMHFGKKLKCKICDKLFLSLTSLNEHVEAHGDERNFQCDRCSKNYIRRSHLNQHIRMIHENPIIVTCEECGKEFSHRASLKKHHRLEHSEKKGLKCNACGKSFGRKSRLTEHYKKCDG